MNVSTNELEKKYFSVEDIVSYSNIEITNVNDNKPPARVIAVKIGVVVVFVIMILLLFLL
ncbi:MAG: hypothetical protein LBC04_03890 [Holosporaceae bacterium]|jgi:hypothetical protein|nr:hypothetical protein [Holosporaceae bacterium]